MHAKPYEIRVAGAMPGRLDDVLDEFPGVAVCTVLTGQVRDQAELHTLLGRLHDLGIELLAFRCLPEPGDAGSAAGPRKVGT